MSLQSHAVPPKGKVLLVGQDPDQVLERRFHAANWHVVTMPDCQGAIDQTRHEPFDVAILVARGSLISTAEAIFNLRDINQCIEILILVERLGTHTSRMLRQLIDHPLERTRILTRRQLQKQIHRLLPQAPPGRDL